jgi:predicted ABC-type ATPase
MKIYTIIGGVNGAGKSSLTGVLRAERSDLGYIIDVDKLAAKEGGDNLKAARIAIARIHRFIDDGITFSQETTLSGHMVERTIREAKDHDYLIHLFYVGLSSAEESIRRIQNRVEKGGHDIPTEDVIRRYSERFPSLARILPYCDEVKFYDNENQFCNVAEFRNGELTYKSDYKPQWITEFQEYLTQEEQQEAIDPDLEQSLNP